jgi:hypothetical protein
VRAIVKIVALPYFSTFEIHVLGRWFFRHTVVRRFGGTDQLIVETLMRLLIVVIVDVFGGEMNQMRLAQHDKIVPALELSRSNKNEVCRVYEVLEVTVDISRVPGRETLSSLLKNAFVAFFKVARRGARHRTAAQNDDLCPHFEIASWRFSSPSILQQAVRSRQSGVNTMLKPSPYGVCVHDDLSRVRWPGELLIQEYLREAWQYRALRIQHNAM